MPCEPEDRLTKPEAGSDDEADVLCSILDTLLNVAAAATATAEFSGDVTTVEANSDAGWDPLLLPATALPACCWCLA